MGFLHPFLGGLQFGGSVCDLIREVGGLMLQALQAFAVSLRFVLQLRQHHVWRRRRQLLESDPCFRFDGLQSQLRVLTGFPRILEPARRAVGAQ